MSERSLEKVSDIVWYDDQHTSGTVYRTGAGFYDDGKVHIPNNIVFNNPVNGGGLNHFNNRATVGGGFKARGIEFSIGAPISIAPDRLYYRVSNTDDIGNVVSVSKPLGSLRRVGMVNIVIANDGGHPFHVQPAILNVENGAAGNRISLDSGELVWLVWVSGGYRVLHTTGTIIEVI